jgi:hypothetical protein
MSNIHTLFDLKNLRKKRKSKGKKYNIVRVLDERKPYTQEELFDMNEYYENLNRKIQLTWYEWFLTLCLYTKSDIIVMRLISKT